MLCGRILRSALRAVHRIPSCLEGPPHIASLHSTAGVCAKMFVDRENQFAHSVLEQSLKPYQIFNLATDVFAQPRPGEGAGGLELPPMVLQPPADAANVLTGDEVFGHFSALTRYCHSTGTPLSDARFGAFTQVFCGACRKLSDAQLLEVLRQIGQLTQEASVREANFVDIWNTVDVVCCERLETWDSNQQLLVCDAWYALNLARICDFVTEALRRLGRKVSRMRPEQLVQAMFLCNVTRRPVYEMFDFEVNLARCLDQMSLQELGIMAMGFFKTQTPIRNPGLIEQFYRRLIAELDTVQDITLVAILKVLRYSSKIPQVDLMTQLLDGLCKQVERISLLSCLHVALLGCDLQYCHDGIVERILLRFSHDIEQSRLKDLERICLVIGLFNFHSASRVEEQLCAKILSELRGRVDEIMRHPRCFPMCLHYLTLKGYHDAEMISAALDKRFIKHAYGSNMSLGREIFHLDAFVKINLRAETSYEGNELSEKMRCTMGKMLTHYIPERNVKYKLNTTDRVLLEIKETTADIFRHNTFKHILPHFERPDVVVCYDRQQRRAIPLSPGCAEDYSGVILTREELLGGSDAPHVDTLAIGVAGWNNVVRGKDKYTGLFDMKLKQLALLGHKYIAIPWHQWVQLETQWDRQDYLKRRLATVINL